jgi:hypothetical protein
VPRGQRDGSLRPYSRLSIGDPVKVINLKPSELDYDLNQIHLLILETSNMIFVFVL